MYASVCKNEFRVFVPVAIVRCWTHDLFGLSVREYVRVCVPNVCEHNIFSNAKFSLLVPPETDIN